MHRSPRQSIITYSTGHFTAAAAHPILYLSPVLSAECRAETYTDQPGSPCSFDHAEDDRTTLCATRRVGQQQPHPS